MLQQNTIDTIKSTIPLLTEHGEAITRCFYTRLFDSHPELKNVFNQANQQKGNQQRALADAVIGYAANIENIAALVPVVSRIAHKHASIGIKPEQYPIVGQNLLAAIQEVLSLADNHPALIAWELAYGVLADIFISAEEKIYQSNESKPQGWRGFKAFVIDRIETETPEVKSFYLKSHDGTSSPEYTAGQYIGLKIKDDISGLEQIRQYSLSGQHQNGHSNKHLRISVKAEPNGLVSNHLHQRVVGDEIMIQAPTGVFNLAEDTQKHVFIAGGVGITPMISMLYEAINKGLPPQNLLFVQCSRGSEYRIFNHELTTLHETTQFNLRGCLDHDEADSNCHHHGFLNAPVIERWLDESEISAKDNTAVYFCGPPPFMKAINQIFLSLSFNPNQIHYETFGPTLAL